MGGHAVAVHACGSTITGCGDTVGDHGRAVLGCRDTRGVTVGGCGGPRSGCAVDTGGWWSLWVALLSLWVAVVSPGGCLCGHYRWPVVSPRVATASPWVAPVPPPAQLPSPAPRCHHPTGAGVPVLPLCPPAAAQPWGQVIPQPHMPVPTGQPSHGDQSRQICGAYFAPCPKAGLTQVLLQGRGSLSPSGPTVPSPLTGHGSPFPDPPGRGHGPLHLPVPSGSPSSLPPCHRQVRGCRDRTVPRMSP